MGPHSDPALGGNQPGPRTGEPAYRHDTDRPLSEYPGEEVRRRDPGRLVRDPAWAAAGSYLGSTDRLRAALAGWHSRPHTPDDDTTAVVRAADELIGHLDEHGRQ
jgi:hypothetical protein